MSENVDDVHFNMPVEDVQLLSIALSDYRYYFNENSEIDQRLENIVKTLESAIHYYYFKSPEKKEKEEQ